MIFEIHCPRCGVLIRKAQGSPKKCPDCGDPQAIPLLWMSPENSLQRSTDYE